VSAAWNGIIMPGRVLRNFNDGNSSACRATAYARVDGNLSLIVPNHCKDAFNEQPYAAAYTNGGVAIGWWGVPGASWQDNDLTYITLDVNSVYYPTSGRNKVYRGDVTNNGLTSDDYWYITTNPTSSDGCAGFPAGGAYPDSSYRMWQSTMASTLDYEFAESLDGWGVTGLEFHGDGCYVFTKFTTKASINCCDSGTPIIRWSDKTTINGFMTGYNDVRTTVNEGTKVNTVGGVRALFFDPLYEGLDDLNTYMVAHSLQQGAWLCQTSAC
jgi:hypothetical protein